MKEIYIIYNIDYDIEDEDIFELVGEQTEQEDYEDYKIRVDKKILEIRNELPKTIQIEIDKNDYKDNYELNDLLADEISNETGWLVNSFNYSKGD